MNNNHYYLQPAQCGYSQLTTLALKATDYAKDNYGEAVIEETEIEKMVADIQGYADKLLSNNKRWRKRCIVRYEHRNWARTQVLMIDGYSITMHPVSKFITQEEKSL